MEMVKAQIKLLFNSHGFIIVVTVMLTLLTGASIMRLTQWYGGSYHLVYSASQATMVFNQPFGNMITMFLLPILTSLFFADSSFTDRQCGVYPFVLLRATRSCYFFSKCLVVFFSCAAVLMLPFALDQLFTLVGFPQNSITDLANAYSFERFASHNAIVHGMLSPNLYYNFPYINNLIHILNIGLYAGALGLFAFALNCFFIKNRITAISLTTILTFLSSVSVYLIPRWSLPMEYLQSNNPLRHADYRVFYFGTAFLILLSLVMVWIRTRYIKDEI